MKIKNGLVEQQQRYWYHLPTSSPQPCPVWERVKPTVLRAPGKRVCTTVWAGAAIPELDGYTGKGRASESQKGGGGRKGKGSEKREKGRDLPSPAQDSFHLQQASPQALYQFVSMQTFKIFSLAAHENNVSCQDQTIFPDVWW